MKSLALLLGLVFLLNFGCNEVSVRNIEREEFTMRTSDSTDLYIKVSGNGPPCIFIHGGPGAWSKSFEIMKGNQLEENFRMIYYDQRGCGKSSKSNNYNLSRMILDIEEIRKHLDLQKIIVMGHSFGGIIATEYCLQFEENVDGLVLLNSTLNISESLRSQIKLSNELTGNHISTKKNDSLLILKFFKAKQNLDSLGLGYKTLTDKKSSFNLLDSIDQLSPSEYDFAKNVWSYPIYMDDFSNRTNQVSRPVLIITGTEDHAIGIDHYKSFDFVNMEINQIQGGHLLYYENNAEFCRAMLEFKKKLMPTTPKLH